MRTLIPSFLASALLVLPVLAGSSAWAQTPDTKAGSEDGPAAADDASPAPALVGTWRSAPEELKLTSDFDESVWGAGARSVRTVDLTVQRSGQATLTVTRKVLDARGRTIPASTSIEQAQLIIGAAQPAVATRIEHDVKVVKADRTYPDDPSSRWALDGLMVKVVTFEGGNSNELEIRFDTPEGRGSFWETLRRGGARSAGRASR